MDQQQQQQQGGQGNPGQEAVAAAACHAISSAGGLRLTSDAEACRVRQDVPALWLGLG